MQQIWLKEWPWETVVTINAGLCKEKGMPHQHNGAGYEAARQAWEEARSHELTLAQALGVCRRAHEYAPFAFFNGNTFVAIGRILVQDVLKRLPPDKAQIFRSVVGHYIAGTTGQEELDAMLAAALDSPEELLLLKERVDKGCQAGAAEENQ